MQNKAVVATADNAENSLRSRRLNPAVPHFRRSATNIAVPKNEIQTSNFAANCNRPTQAKNR